MVLRTLKSTNKARRRTDLNTSQLLKKHAAGSKGKLFLRQALQNNTTQNLQNHYNPATPKNKVVFYGIFQIL
ncbi:MAG: hypothetical protein SCH70_12965 [Candidatus Methanoperedens sp.]|nr:hypothetical protein [Candidatus Methanoperedens sp.]